MGDPIIGAKEVARRTLLRKTTVIGGVLERECNALFETAHHNASQL